ncbi:hypothetical protein QJS66_13995 [Kocuria rhizophila]|nr:hypothetical protein QJS66_13995 [Kocuria rhizophila]
MLMGLLGTALPRCSDRDAVPAQVLTNQLADVIQIWLPSWWQNREQAVRMCEIAWRLYRSASSPQNGRTMRSGLTSIKMKGGHPSMGHDEGLGIKAATSYPGRVESVPDAL